MSRLFFESKRMVKIGVIWSYQSVRPHVTPILRTRGFDKKSRKYVASEKSKNRRDTVRPKYAWHPYIGNRAICQYLQCAFETQWSFPTTIFTLESYKITVFLRRMAAGPETAEASMIGLDEIHFVPDWTNLEHSLRPAYPIKWGRKLKYYPIKLDRFGWGTFCTSFEIQLIK